MSNTPLDSTASTAPPPKLRYCVLQVAVPPISTSRPVRSRLPEPLLSARSPEKVVVPLPLIVPPVQALSLNTVSAPAPVRVPPVSERLPEIWLVEARLSVPPERARLAWLLRLL